MKRMYWTIEQLELLTTATEKRWSTNPEEYFPLEANLSEDKEIQKASSNDKSVNIIFNYAKKAYIEISGAFKKEKPCIYMDVSGCYGYVHKPGFFENLLSGKVSERYRFDACAKRLHNIFIQIDAKNSGEKAIYEAFPEIATDTLLE
jgi:hypothetical protein